MWSPVAYQEAAVLSKEVGEELLSRLEWMAIKPQVVVDLGCGVGELSARLRERYPAATVIAIDASDAMIQQTKRLTSQVLCVQAEASQLPFANQSVDLIAANLLTPWCDDLSSLLQEWRRVLRPDGLLIFTSLGPDTLKEWRPLLNHQIASHCIDMHELGDLILKTGLADPVLDVEYYTITYRTLNHLYQELHASGILLSDTVQANDAALSDEGTWSVTYEAVFAHAFAPANKDEVSASDDGVVRMPLSYLRKRLRSQSGE